MKTKTKKMELAFSKNDFNYFHHHLKGKRQLQKHRQKSSPPTFINALLAFNAFQLTSLARVFQLLMPFKLIFVSKLCVRASQTFKALELEVDEKNVPLQMLVATKRFSTSLAHISK